MDSVIVISIWMIEQKWKIVMNSRKGIFLLIIEQKRENLLPLCDGVEFIIVVCTSFKLSSPPSIVIPFVTINNDDSRNCKIKNNNSAILVWSRIDILNKFTFFLVYLLLPSFSLKPLVPLKKTGPLLSTHNTWCSQVFPQDSLLLILMQ